MYLKVLLKVGTGSEFFTTDFTLIRLLAGVNTLVPYKVRDLNELMMRLLEDWELGLDFLYLAMDFHLLERMPRCSLGNCTCKVSSYHELLHAFEERNTE